MKKKAFIPIIEFLYVLFFGLLSCSLNDTNTKDSTKYYTQLAGIISPNLEYQGRGEVSEENAKSLMHYRFNYNREGALLSIQFFDKNQPSNNSYYGTHQVTYTLSGHQLIRSYFNSRGRKATVYRHYYLGDNIHKEIFQLDNYRFKNSLILMDSLDNQIESGMESYLFEFEKVDDRSFIQRQFKKDGSPNVLTAYFPFIQSKITINSNNFLYSIENVDNQGNPVSNLNTGYAKIVFDFDDYGNELGWSFLDMAGNLSNRKEYFGMDCGFAKVSYEFYWKNKTLGLYNGFREMYFDEDNEPSENDKGIQSILYEYDEEGNFLRMTKYNLEGTEVNQSK